MTDIQREHLEAEIKLALTHRIPSSIQTFDKWDATVDASTKAVMDVIEKHRRDYDLV